MTGLVRIAGERVVADSRDVAHEFGKQHAHVLRAIDTMVREQDHLKSNFGLEAYSVATGDGGKRMARRFDMDRKGFMLLVMGFQGSKALAIKSRWIDAFDAMERALTETAVMVGSNDDDADVDDGDGLLDMRGSDEIEQLKVKIALVREARHVYGRRTAQAIWEQVGLPQAKSQKLSLTPGVRYSPDHLDQTIARYLAERTVADDQARIEATLLYLDYAAWCAENDVPKWVQTGFGRQLTRCGIRAHKSGRVWRLGVRLKI